MPNPYLKILYKFTYYCGKSINNAQADSCQFNVLTNLTQNRPFNP